MPQRKFLGVTVLPEYIQTEGIDRVLENLAAIAPSWPFVGSGKL